MNAPRTITLPTLDHGDVTLTCPAWCAGHADHRPDTHRADILHKGPDVALTFHGGEVIAAGLAQSPFASPSTPDLGGRTPGASVYPPGRTLDPVGLYGLAAALDSYADQLRDLADQLAAILAGGDR
ncbi:hypothetical protein PV383_38370 [Streptomyces caniscabiei]|uniref:Uncharacterized protein n=1 Tax=Streptomyces caniscabiei TaxID=2746961 RepID=A0ABU4N397_9ACTN|nr:hypothetical protein [Streptomyces caniscabiei]MDX2946799.1 hypothetical protein [Streptomyces caniscabiei]MDX3043003.1 hypothetical protein [Streptomyces caniscabiei]